MIDVSQFNDTKEHRMKFLTEDSYVEASVRGADGITRHESFDAVDLIESGVTMDKILAEYKGDGVQVVTIQVVF
jgi:hypothetical protein